MTADGAQSPGQWSDGLKNHAYTKVAKVLHIDMYTKPQGTLVSTGKDAVDPTSNELKAEVRLCFTVAVEPAWGVCLCRLMRVPKREVTDGARVALASTQGFYLLDQSFSRLWTHIFEGVLELPNHLQRLQLLEGQTQLRVVDVRLYAGFLADHCPVKFGVNVLTFRASVERG